MILALRLAAFSRKSARRWKDDFEGTAGFAGPHHVHVELAERFWGVSTSLPGELRPAFHVVDHVDQRVLERTGFIWRSRMRANAKPATRRLEGWSAGLARANVRGSGR